MLDWLHELFASVCGQNLAHTWAPGGQLLPCCQRCTGVYVGTCAAALVHLATPPAPTRFWRWLHGAFLLFMIPAGFHWLPQGPALRAASIAAAAGGGCGDRREGGRGLGRPVPSGLVGQRQEAKIVVVAAAANAALISKSEPGALQLDNIGRQ